MGEAMTGTAAVVALICTDTTTSTSGSGSGSGSGGSSGQVEQRADDPSRVHRIWVANVGDCRAVVAVPQDPGGCASLTLTLTPTPTPTLALAFVSRALSSRSSHRIESQRTHGYGAGLG